MKPRLGSVVILVIGVLALWAAFEISHQNSAILNQQVMLFRLPGQPLPMTRSVGIAMLACFALGAITIALVWGWRGIQELWSGLMDRRSSKRERENEEAYHRGLELLLHGRPERALAAMNEILARDADHGAALMTAADILRSLRRPDEAILLRRRRLASAADDVAALLALASDLRESGDLDGAARTLQDLVDLRPRQALAGAERLREVLLQAGRPEEALAAHDKLVRMREGAQASPEDEIERAGIETRIAVTMADAGKDRDAAALARKVLKKHPRYVPAWLALARAHGLGGDEDQAIEAWIEGFEKTNEAGILVEAEQYFQESRKDGDLIERANAALRTFKRFAACSGSRPVAVAFLGKLYLRHQMLEEAAAAFESVRERFPEDPTFAYYSARIAEKQGRPEVAARLYRSIIKAMDVLSLRFRCRNCGWRTAEYEDRCGGCHRWGVAGLEVGADDDALHGRRPLYAVPEDDAGKVEQDALA